MIPEVQETAKLISEVGIMETVSAAFLILSLVGMGVMIAYFKKIIDALINDMKSIMNDLVKETRLQNDKLNDISEGLRPETKERLRAVINAYFDLAIEKVSRILKRVKKENNIKDHEATHAKIMRLVTNLHKDRNSKFSNFSWRGVKINKSTNPDWIPMVSDVVEKELYSEDPNEERTYTNIKNIYDTIRNDYYERLGLE